MSEDVLKSKATMTPLWLIFFFLPRRVSELKDPGAPHHVGRDVLQLKDALDVEPRRHSERSSDVS